MGSECVNCGHTEADHSTNTNGETICLGDNTFDDGTPQCDCDLFEEEDEESD